MATSQNGIKEDGTEDEDQSTSSMPKATLPQASDLSPLIKEMAESTEEAKTTKDPAL